MSTEPRYAQLKACTHPLTPAKTRDKVSPLPTATRLWGYTLGDTSTDGLMDVEQAATYLGISAHTLRKWVQRREIPYYRIGRQIRFTPEQLSAFVAANAQ